MFATRYFSARYFAPRYFPEVGANPAPPSARNIDIAGSVGTSITIAGSVGTSIAIGGSNIVATISNVSCYRGEAVVLTNTLSPSPTAGIAGWSITFSLKRNYGDALALVTKTVGAGVTITDATNGVFTVALTTADTNLPFGVYHYDCWRTDSGSETELTIGTFTVLAEVRL